MPRELPQVSEHPGHADCCRLAFCWSGTVIKFIKNKDLESYGGIMAEQLKWDTQFGLPTLSWTSLSKEIEINFY